jgi:hypothetical protein
MQTLSLTAPNVAYALFGARPPATNGSSVYADNLTFSQIPEQGLCCRSALHSAYWSGMSVGRVAL